MCSCFPVILWSWPCLHLFCPWISVHLRKLFSTWYSALGSLLPLRHFHLSFEPMFPPAQLLFLCLASRYSEGQGCCIKPKGLCAQFPIWKFSRGYYIAFQRIQIAKQNIAFAFEHWRLRVRAHKHLTSCRTSATSQQLPMHRISSLCACRRACPSYHREWAASPLPQVKSVHMHVQS